MTTRLAPVTRAQQRLDLRVVDAARPRRRRTGRATAVAWRRSSKPSRSSDSAPASGRTSRIGDGVALGVEEAPAARRRCSAALWNTGLVSDGVMKVSAALTSADVTVRGSGRSGIKDGLGHGVPPRLAWPTYGHGFHRQQSVGTATARRQRVRFHGGMRMVHVDQLGVFRPTGRAHGAGCRCRARCHAESTESFDSTRFLGFVWFSPWSRSGSDLATKLLGGPTGAPASDTLAREGNFCHATGLAGPSSSSLQLYSNAGHALSPTVPLSIHRCDRTTCRQANVFPGRTIQTRPVRQLQPRDD